MKKTKIFILVICMISIIAIGNMSYAGIEMSASQVNVSVGQSKSVTLTGSGVTGTVKVESSNTAVATVSSANWVENESIPIKITGESEGTAIITISGTVADSNSTTGEDSYYSRTINVTVASTSSSGGSSTSGSSSSSGSTSGSSTTTTPEKESGNANLSNLGIRPNDFSGFTPETTTYNVTVPEDVESVEVYATAQDSGATISGTGNKTLEYGENALSVVVTAEDGTTKTYTINVTREGEEATEEPTEIVNGLSNITIGDLELTPSFKTDVYEYTVKYIGEDTSLDIETVATDPSYTVEILGNEDLKEGENTITILVNDSEGNNVATYQLTVNKSLVDEEALAREEEERQQQEQRRMLMIAGGIIALILIIVIIIVIRRRRNRAYAEEFSGVPFAGINDEDDYYNNYDNYDDYDNYNNDNQFDNYNDEPENEQDAFLQQENDIEVEDLPTEENQETSNQLELGDSQEQKEKERAKRDFLAGYNSDYTDEYEEDRLSKGRKKGKRFK